MILFNYAKKDIISLGTIPRETYKKLVDIIRQGRNHTLVFTGDMTYYEDSPYVTEMSRKGGSGMISKQKNSQS